MKRLRALIMRFAGLFNKRRTDREFDDEIESHLQMHIEDNLRLGMTSEEARREAMIKLGGIESTKEAYRDQRGLPVLETLWQDIRYGARMLRKNPGFTCVAVLTLALGIGANTAIFSFINAILLRPLPYTDADRLVMVYENYRANGWLKNAVAAPLLEIWRTQTTRFEGLAARGYSGSSPVLMERGSPEILTGWRVSANVFGLLGVRPVLGRDFLPEEEFFGKHHVVLLSYEFWQGRFGGDTNIIGRSITLDSEPKTVIGIMPRGTHFPKGGTQVWLPLAFESWELRYRHAHNYLVLGKLKPGVTVAQADAELSLIAERMAAADAENKGWGTEVHALQQEMVGEVQRVLFVLLGAVGLVLLIGCANIANLLLARSTARAREFAIRSALGAGRRRLIRQLLAESMLLCAAGGLGGCLLAMAGLRGLIRFSPPDLPRVWESIHLDGTALAFAALVTLATGLFFGLAPSLKASTPDLAHELAESARGTGGLRRSRLRSALVVVEVALSVILLIAAGLMIRSFGRLLTQDFGFDSEQLVTINLNLPRKKYPQEADSRRFFDQLLPRIHGLPGVRAAGVVYGLPLSGSIEGQDLELVGAAPLKPGELLTADYAQVSPGYFATMNIPLLYGRDFSERDTTNAPLALIVNESFIRQFGLGTNVLGRRLKISDSSKRESEIIGVVRDSKGNALAEPTRGAMYRSYRQFCRGQMTLVIRTQLETLDITRAVRAQLDNLDKDLPLENVRTMTQWVESSVAQRKLSVRLLGGFAGVALLLAAIGLYGVLAYGVAQRTREIGIRTALGAQRGDVIRLVLQQGMKLAGLGVLIGLAGASVLTNLIRSLLYGVGPTDPLTFALIPVLLGAVALLACWLPARRAARVHPMIALRYE